ncbi:Rhodanese-like domain protein [compost metagenome]
MLALWNLCENQLSDIPRIKEDLLHQYEGIRTISKEDLLQRILANSIIVLDLRPRDEYEAGHIEGAISVPLNELDAYLQTLPQHVELAVYCRGPFCVNPAEAVEHI